MPPRLSAFIAALFVAASATAQTWPDKPIKLVVPYPPGGNVDIAAELGYSEPSAFFRAFHGWTGEGPSAHRRRLNRGD
jgi:hypothetical protein